MENGQQIYDLVDGKCIRNANISNTPNNQNNNTSTTKKLPIAAIAGGAAGLVVLIGIIIISIKCCKKAPTPNIATANVASNLSGVNSLN